MREAERGAAAQAVASGLVTSIACFTSGAMASCHFSVSVSVSVCVSVSLFLSRSFPLCVSLSLACFSSAAMACFSPGKHGML